MLIYKDYKEYIKIIHKDYFKDKILEETLGGSLLMVVVEKNTNNDLVLYNIAFY